MHGCEPRSTDRASTACWPPPTSIEDLLLLGALEDKVVIASMNRGGLSGSVFELDDRMTGYDVRGTVEAGFNGAKMLTRIDLDRPRHRGHPGGLRRGRHRAEPGRPDRDARTVPGPPRSGGRVVNDLSPDAVISSVHIAQGLGASSAYTWLKLPVVAEMDRVMDATTLPTLLLGGDPSGHPDETYAEWAKALALPSVRGLVVGRALLYPLDDDVGDSGGHRRPAGAGLVP